MEQVSLEHAMQIAVELHQRGQRAQAEEIYRQVLAQNPRQVAALHLLGVAAHQDGKSAGAIDLIGRAITLEPDNPALYSDLGEAFRAAGRLDEAVAAFSKAIELRPDYATAHNNLGNVRSAQLRFEEAAKSFSQAIALRPGYATAELNLGNALTALGRFEEAEAACRRAIALQPLLAEARSNLGDALVGQEQTDNAVAAYEQALRLNPNLARTHHRLSIALQTRGEFDPAAEACRKGVALDPGLTAAHCTLARIHIQRGHFDAALAEYSSIAADPATALYEYADALSRQSRLRESAEAFSRAIELKGNVAEGRRRYAAVLSLLWRIDDAIVQYRKAIELEPDSAETWAGLGYALKEKPALDEAADACRKALSLDPANAQAQQNLGLVLKDCGLVDDALDCFARAIMLLPNPAWHSNYLYTLQFSPRFDEQALLREQRRWSLLFAHPLKRFRRTNANDPTPGRKLRIGYFSPNFYSQAEAHFVLPLLENHDHRQVEIFCYSHGLFADPITLRHRRSADQWHEVRGRSDGEIAEMIRRHGIDILIDLNMHMGESMLAVFARKPAPVQITWLAYPGGTGMEAMDYRLTDNYLDPPESDCAQYVEKSIRLPDWWGVYDPCSDAAPAVERPIGWDEPICFGSLNNPCKMSGPTIQVWARVMHLVPDSRLLLLASSAQHQERLRRQFAEAGIAGERLQFSGHAPRVEYLRLYDRIDIGLDPLPYNGITTTLDALWMGVPVVSLVGRTAAGRAGLGILTTLGLPELATRSEDGFVAAAAELANDQARQRSLRGGLREKIKASPLMDGLRFARTMEGIYRQAWERWCAGRT